MIVTSILISHSDTQPHIVYLALHTSATSECCPPLPDSNSVPKSVVGVSHRLFHSRLKTHLFSRSIPP